MRKKSANTDGAWKKVDQQLLLLKQGNIKTQIAKNSKQIYRLRVVKWADYQAVVEKRLYRFSESLMDFIPGRLMSLNMQDIQIILQNQDKIMQIMKKTYDELDDNSIYKRQIIFHKEQEQKESKKLKEQEKNKK